MMKTDSLMLMRALFAWAWLLIPAGAAQGQVIQVVPQVIFNGTNGAFGVAPLIDGPNGNLYGATGMGGTNSNGTIYSVNTNGSFNSLFSFDILVPDTNGVGTNYTGVGPSVPLALGTDGNLYGMCLAGGSDGNGTIFKLTTNGSLTALVNFTGTNGTNLGASPLGAGGLVLGKDGNFYGVTRYGGTNVTGSVGVGTNGCGTIFKMTPGGTFTTLVNFTGTNGAAPGAGPTGGLLQWTDGNFYGTTRYGGTNDEGTIFKMTTNGTFASLLSFLPLVPNGDTTNGNFGTNATGAQPINALVPGSDGNLYGSAPIGGLGGEGTVFRFYTNGTLTNIYSFTPLVPTGTSRPTNYDGAAIAGNLAPGPGGVFYATPSNGGAHGAGTIIAITTNGTLTTLYSFSSLVANKNVEGGDPFGVTFGSDGNVYGVNYIGGADGEGSTYRVNLAALTIQLVSGKAVLTWTNSAYGLQSASAANGIYTTISGASSPYTNAFGGQKFFRLIGN
jgi:uncharacterized repeat protein (TIGR03803 family)